MILRKFKLEDSAVISKWIKTEEELYKWSADRFNKFPLDENDINSAMKKILNGLEGLGIELRQ